jgi:beta-phosphoglucomutase-like phosphatase (HAD superfamily)
MIRAVIFDIDGTLIDSVDVHAQAWQHAFHDFGFEIPYNDVRLQIGKGGDRLVPSLLRDADVKRVGEKLQEYRSKLFQREYLSKIKAFADVRELFQRLRRDGKRIVLGSSAKGEELESYKRIANISDPDRERNVGRRCRSQQTFARYLSGCARQTGWHRREGGRRHRGHAL